MTVKFVYDFSIANLNTFYRNLSPYCTAVKCMQLYVSVVWPLHGFLRLSPFQYSVKYPSLLCCAINPREKLGEGAWKFWLPSDPSIIIIYIQ